MALSIKKSDSIEFKCYMKEDIRLTKKFIKERRKNMRKKNIKKEFERLNGEISRLETLVKAATYKAETAQKKIDILEFAGTFDMNKVEIEVNHDLIHTLIGLMSVNPSIKIKYIKDGRIECSKCTIDEDTADEISNKKPTIIKNDDKIVLFAIGNYQFVLNRETGFMMEFPAIEKKAKEKKS